MKNFNTTGQVYLLLAVLVITIGLAISTVIIFLVREQEPILVNIPVVRYYHDFLAQRYHIVRKAFMTIIHIDGIQNSIKSVS